jgi:serine/threonine protein kinase
MKSGGEQDQSQERDKDTSNIEPKLISQGGYGCVYYPSFPAKMRTKEIKSSKKYISKLQKKNYPSQFEDFIGKIIQNIPGYNNFFVPVLKTYDIDLASINSESIQKCDAVTKFVKKQAKHYDDQDGHDDRNKYGYVDEEKKYVPIDYDKISKHFIIQKMKYIEGALDLKKYLYKLISNKANNIKNIDITAASVSKINKSESTDESYDTYKANDDHDEDDEDAEDNTIKAYEKILETQTQTQTQTHGDKTRVGSKSKKMQTAGKKRLHKQMKILEEDNRLHKEIIKSLEEYSDTTEDKQTNRNNNKISYNLISILFDCYERIADCLHLLAKNQIVHNDLKYNNILINSDTLTPIIIDFGLSIYIKQLLENPWSEKNEKDEEVTADTLKPHSRGRENNYYWKQHFYIHAPDYYLWPIESHIISFLIIESETNTLTYENLQEIAYTFTYNHEALMYMSTEFKQKYMQLCISVYKKYIDRPREEVINKLIQYWQKWDIYSHNVMFIRLFYSIVIKIDNEYKDVVSSSRERSSTSATTGGGTNTTKTATPNPETPTNPDKTNMNVHFEEMKLKLKSFYFLNEDKILDIIEFIIMNMHPDPEKRLLPEEAKNMFNAILNNC